MSRAGKITRRALLVGSVAVAGGVAFVGYQAVRTPPNPLSPESGAALNPWLVIDRSGITVIVPRAEMGQGVRTTLAALVAEELDADLAAIRIEHGPPAQAYFNGAVSADRGYDQSREPMPSGLGQISAEAMPKLMSMQITGGSTSTGDAFEKMRIAGAGARATLIGAAAKRLGLAPSQLSTEMGAVLAPDGTRLPYTELAEEAAKLSPPRDVRLKPRSAWRYLGKSQPRHDQLPKATGTATFGIDIRPEGLLFATVRMSPVYGARIADLDTSAAQGMAGVEKIVNLGDGIGVIASNTWLAFQAANAIEVTWEAPDYPPDDAGIFAALADQLAKKPDTALREDGDAEAALAAGGDGEIFEAEYRVPYLAHATMEPMNATALYEPDHLTIWTGGQAPVMFRDHCAKIAGLSSEQVTLHTPFLGGGFGRRGIPDAAALATRLAMEMPGRPVQCTWSREEDMRHDQYRPAALARFRARLAQGRIAALDAAMACQSTLALTLRISSGFDLPVPDRTATEGSHDQPYAIENFRVRGHEAKLAVPVGFWRSVGGSQNGFFHESFIDELAHEAGADPLAFRLAHIRPEHAPSAKVLERVGEMAGWTGQSAPGVGRGVAHVWSFGTSVAEIVEVREEDGLIRVSDIWIAADPGPALDPANIEAQLSGGALYGLSAAIFGEITLEDGIVQQENFPDYDAVRMANCPRFHIELLENNSRIGGVGEPGTPPVAPALANALFDLTGKRARQLPLRHMFDFVI